RRSAAGGGAGARRAAPLRRGAGDDGGGGFDGRLGEGACRLRARAAPLSRDWGGVCAQRGIEERGRRAAAATCGREAGAMPLRYRQRLLDHLKHETYEPATVSKLAEDLGVGEGELGLFRQTVEELAEAGDLMLDRRRDEP